MIVSEVFHYTTSRWDWHDGNVNQMWIEEIEESKRRFESDGTLPASDSLVAFSVDYLELGS